MNNEYSNTIIEMVLSKFKAIIGEDYERYRNHVYRVFLNCLLFDRNKDNEEKYAFAAVFHDIGIWTNHTIDYLNPSILQAEIYFTDTGKTDFIEEIKLMIYWHHKTSSYKGKYEITVEIFRKADWIDVSLGFLTYGADRKKISLYKKQLPDKGFHWFLVKKITANFFRHPLHPLPMFTK